jgi:hypothetical protein
MPKASNGHDWTDRYPPIVESALRNKLNSFVIDGEAVLLGVDGVSDFDGLHSRLHDAEVQLYAFDILALDGDDLRNLPLGMRKANLARLWWCESGGRRASMRIDHRSASARSAFRMASFASSRAPSARIWAPVNWPPKIVSRDLVLIAEHYSGACGYRQCHYAYRLGTVRPHHGSVNVQCCREAPAASPRLCRDFGARPNCRRCTMASKPQDTWYVTFEPPRDETGKFLRVTETFASECV